MRRLWVVMLVAAACSGGSNPAEMARERGALELVREWPCAGGRTLGAVVGGDLKTDWSARRDGDAYAVTMGARTFRVRLAQRTVEPSTAAARDDWARCRPR